MNRVLSYRRDHPGNRSSYGVAGVPGLVVIHHSLLAGFDQPGFQPPAVINVDIDLAEPRGDKRSEKAAERAAKAAERAEKAAKRAAEAQTRLAEFRAKTTPKTEQSATVDGESEG